jgi:hypothetical protein
MKFFTSLKAHTKKNSFEVEMSGKILLSFGMECKLKTILNVLSERFLFF